MTDKSPNIDVCKIGGAEFAFVYHRNPRSIEFFPLVWECARKLRDDPRKVCSSILVSADITCRLDQIEWAYTTPFYQSKLVFYFGGGEILYVTLSNRNVLHSGNDRFIADDLKTYLKSGTYGQRDGGPRDITLEWVFYFAPTPFRRSKYLVCEPLASDGPVVLLDTKTFIRDWREQSQPGSKLANLVRRRFEFHEKGGNRDDLELINSTRSLSKKWSLVREMPCGVGFNYRGEIAFSNGRHRTVNLANAGSPYIPVQVAVDQEEVMRDRFEWPGVNGL